MMCPFDPTVELEEIEFLDQEYLGCPKCEEIWSLPLDPKKWAELEAYAALQRETEKKP